MLLGTFTVIDTVISESTTAYYSGSEFFDALSQGERSNNGAAWKELFTADYTVAAADPLPWNDFADVGLLITTGQLGSKTRVSINATEDMVKVKIIVCVRG